MPTERIERNWCHVCKKKTCISVFLVSSRKQKLCSFAKFSVWVNRKSSKVSFYGLSIVGVWHICFHIRLLVAIYWLPTISVLHIFLIRLTVLSISNQCLVHSILYFGLPETFYRLARVIAWPNYTIGLLVAFNQMLKIVVWHVCSVGPMVAFIRFLARFYHCLFVSCR